MRVSRRSGLALALAASLLAGACSVEPGGTPLERGLWREETRFGTPNIDGLSVDALRKQLPANTSKTECAQPLIRSGDRVTQMLSLRSGICSLAKATTERGTIAAEGTCEGLAKKLSRTGKADSWIKITGDYTPRSILVDAELVITMKADTGSTERMTVSATHRAERLGDCP